MATLDDDATGTSGSEATGNFATLAPDEWFTSRQSSTCWLALYSFVGTTRSQIETVMKDARWRTGSHPAVRVGVGRIADLKLATETHVLYGGDPVGSPAQLFVKVEEFIPPAMDVWFMVTPFRIDGSLPDPDAANRVARLAALMAAYCGPNLLRHVVYEGEVSAQTGQVTVTGDAIRLPQRVEGPFLGARLVAGIAETVERVRGIADATRRGRLELAIEYLGRAIRNNDDFFCYWTALELVADGKAPKIRGMLQRCYGLKSHAPIENSTGFPTLRNWRHGFIHGGIRPHLTPDVARYLHALFLDLIRFELDLPPLHLLSSTQSQSGYDLRPLGLPDSRTEAQKAVASRHQLDAGGDQTVTAPPAGDA